MDQPLSECLRRSADAPVDWPVAMCDTFDDAGGWDTGLAEDETSVTSRTVVDGTYVWDTEAYQPHRSQRMAGTEPAGDFYVAADMYAVEEHAGDVEYGLLFRVADAVDSYMFKVSNDGFFGVYRELNGEPTVLQASALPDGLLHPGDWNRLGVAAVGPTIVLYVNGSEVGRVSDPFVPKGWLGLTVNVLQPGHLVVYFDNFEVRLAPSGAQLPPPPAKRLAACPGSPAEAPADWPISACDTFDTNELGWRVGDQSGGSLTEAMANIGGTYFCAFKAAENTYWWLEPNLPPSSDFFVSVQAKRSSLMNSSGYGLVFRMEDYDNFFTFVVDDSQRFKVVIKVGGWFRNLIEPTGSTAIRPGETNTLAVKGERRHFTFYINDQQVAELDDVHFRQGKVGIMVVPDRGDGGYVEFDDFEVRSPLEDR